MKAVKNFIQAGFYIALSYFSASPDLWAASDIVLLLDGSSLTAQPDLAQQVHQATTTFITTLSQDAWISVIAFDHITHTVSPLKSVDETEYQELTRALAALRLDARYTHSPAAVERAITTLEAGRIDANKWIILIGDGKINTGNAANDALFSEWLTGYLSDKAATAGIRISTLALTSTADTKTLKVLAAKTDGHYFGPGNTQLASALAVLTADLNAKQSDHTSAKSPNSSAVSDETKTPWVAQPPATDPTSKFEVPLPSPPEVTQQPTVQQPAVKDAAPETQTSESTPGVLDPLRTLPRIFWGLAGAILLALIITLSILRLRTGGTARGPSAPELNSYAPSIGAQPALLKDLSGITQRQIHDITGKLTWISRTDGEDSATVQTITIQNDHISRNHAFIQYHDHAYWLSDRDSRNGTYVNGRRIDRAQMLKHGDVIRFARHDFLFTLSQRQDLAETRLMALGPTSEATQVVPHIAGQHSGAAPAPSHPRAPDEHDETLIRPLD